MKLPKIINKLLNWYFVYLHAGMIFILFIMSSSLLIWFTLTLHLLMLQACKTLGGFPHYIRTSFISVNRTFWWPWDVCILPGSRSHCGDMCLWTLRLHVAIVPDNEQGLPRSSSTTSFEPRMKVPRLNAHVPHTPRNLSFQKSNRRPSPKCCQSTPFYALLLLFSTSYGETARIFCCCRREAEASSWLEESEAPPWQGRGT